MGRCQPGQRYDFASSEFRAKLRPRQYVLWRALTYGRHIGYRAHPRRPTWYARYRNSEGKYKQHRLGRAGNNDTADGHNLLSYEQAVEAALKWFSLEGNRGRTGNTKPLGCCDDLIYCPIGDVYTVGHALRDYFEWKRIISTRSHVLTLVSLISYHLMPRLGLIPADSLTPELVTEFVRDVLETPARKGTSLRQIERRPVTQLKDEALRCRKATLNTLIGIMRVALSMAWENGKINNERCWRLFRRVPNASRPRMLHLSRNECRRLIAECGPALRKLVVGALYTGCRVTELIRMEVSHVAHDGYGIYVPPIKSARSRFVFLPDEAMVFFLDLVKSKRLKDRIFLQENGYDWSSSYRYYFKLAVRAAGLPEAFTFHGLRHTYASQLAQAGVPLLVIAEQLGHANAATVGSTYGHISPQIRESEVRQRFMTLDPNIARIAKKQNRKLRAMRMSYRGNCKHTYATISDLHSPRHN